MKRSERTRRVKRVGAAAVFLLLAGVVCVFLARLKLGIPCMFHLLTGWECPGCGISRMFLALLRGDVAAAWRFNPAAFSLLLPGILLLLRVLSRYLKRGSLRLTPAEDRFVCAAAALLVLFGVARNLPVYPYPL